MRAPDVRNDRRREAVREGAATRGALALGALALSLAMAPTSRADGPDPLRVLFIGNSYTRFNGLPRIVRRVSRSVEGGRPIVARRETHPGFTLRQHWRHRRLRRRVARGGFDTVVLQGRSTSPLETPEELREYARRFAEHANQHGAEVVLFETWPRRAGHRLYHRSPELDGPTDMLARIEDVYLGLSESLEAPVAPVGRAWTEARRALPDTPLHRPDGTHPTLAGTYLAACVLYTALTGEDPRRATYVPYPLPRATAARLRELAGAVTPVTN